jgi:hypothetical protein
LQLSCPRCAGPVRPPSPTGSDWLCDQCGPVPPLRTATDIGSDVLAATVGALARQANRASLWCPWPLPNGWSVTGVGWVGDEGSGAPAAVLACSGPAPLTGGQADLLLVSEAPGTGLANRYADLAGVDPGPLLAEAVAGQPAHAKPRAGGHPTPLWSVPAAAGCSAYVGEARGVWLVALAWPPTAGYLLVDDLELADLVDWLPPELAYGAVSARLLGTA